MRCPTVEVTPGTEKSVWRRCHHQRIATTGGPSTSRPASVFRTTSPARRGRPARSPRVGRDVEALRIVHRVRQGQRAVVRQVSCPIGAEGNDQPEGNGGERRVDRRPGGGVPVNDLVLERVVPRADDGQGGEGQRYGKTLMPGERRSSACRDRDGDRDCRPFDSPRSHETVVTRAIDAAGVALLHMCGSKLRMMEISTTGAGVLAERLGDAIARTGLTSARSRSSLESIARRSRSCCRRPIAACPGPTRCTRSQSPTSCRSTGSSGSPTRGRSRPSC